MRVGSCIPSWCLILVIMLTALSARTVRADAGAADKAAAEALFDQGIALMRTGDFAAACLKLEQSQSVDHGIGTMLYLAECYEKSGRTASAWAMFRQAASEAAASGETDRAATGRSRAEHLAPTLSTLSISVAAVVPGLSVTRNDVNVSSAVWGVAVPVDPGEHRIVAQAPGYATWSMTVSVKSNADIKTVAVPGLSSLAGLVPAPNAPPAAAPLPVPAPVAAQPAPASPAPAAPSLSLGAPADAHDGAHSQRIIGVVTGAVGIAAIGVGAIFGVTAISKNSDAERLCKGTVCSDPRGVSLTHDAQNAAALSNIFVIGGAVLAAAGVVLYVTAHAGPERSLAVTSDGHAVRLTLAGAL